MIYQIHHQHGRTIAYDSAQEEANTSRGWKTVSEDEFNGLQPAIEGESVEINESELSERESLVLEYDVRFGRKPPHNMKIENIKAKLDE